MKRPSPSPTDPGRRRALRILASCAAGLAIGAAAELTLHPLQRLVIRLKLWRAGHNPWPQEVEPVIPVHEQGKLALFVLAGQSNMSGRGRLDSQSTAATAPVYVFGNDDHWHRVREPIDNGWEQVDRVSFDVVVGVGPGPAFAERWAELNPGVPIGLIPCAMGGSSIQDWQRNLNSDSLYGSLLRRCREAKAQGEIRGVLYFQGESDATQDRANHWNQAFLRWANDLRSDLGAPELPIVFAQLGDGRRSSDPAAWQRLQELQSDIDLPHGAMIKTSDLPLADEEHFTTPAYRTVGRRFAEAMHSLTRAAESVTAPRPSPP